MLLPTSTSMPMVSPDTSVRDAIAQMSKAAVDYVLVVEKGYLQGWLTAQDVLKLVVQDKLGDDCPLISVVSQPPCVLSLKEAEDLAGVMRSLQKYGVHQLPVIADSGELSGLVTAQGIVPFCSERLDYIQQLKQKTEELFLARVDQEYLLQEVTNSVEGIIYVYDLDKQHNVYLNKSITTFLGYSVEEVNVKEVIPSLIHPDDKPIMFALAELEGKVPAPDDAIWKSEYRARHADGRWRWLSSHDRPFRYHRDGRLKQIIGIAYDITERKQMELELASSKHFLESITESVPGIIFVYDLATKSNVYINPHIVKILGYTPEQFQAFGDNLPEQLIHPEDLPKLYYAHPQQLAVTPVSEIEYRIKNAYGEWQWLLERVVVFQTNPDGSPSQILGTCIDISDRKNAEDELQKLNNVLEDMVRERTLKLRQTNLQLVLEIREKTEIENALRESEDKFQRMVANIPGMVYQFHRDLEGNYSFTYASDYSQELYELTPADITKDMNSIISLCDPDDHEKIINAIDLSFRALEPYYFLGLATTPSGKVKWIEAISRPRKLENGEVLWDGILMDKTDREVAQAQVVRDLQEKEVLLREIHHRVKNNLQVITSLLYLQCQYVKDPALIALFQESQNRIYSMALIHEQLYKSTRLDQINFAEYVRDLVTHLRLLYNSSQSLIEIEINIANIFLNIQTAIPCGLIINEVIVNALKYAFSKDIPGQITIEFQRIEGQRYSLLIKDNGVGMPESFNLNMTKTLGLRLVKMLTRQLDGEVTLTCQPGTQFVIIFPELRL